MWAALHGNLDICEMLVQECGQPADYTTDKGETALQKAAANGHWEVCEFLIENGAKVNQTDSEHQTALMWAAAEGHLQTVKGLVQMDAKVDLATKLGKTALLLGAQYGREEVCKFLITQAASVDHQDAEGQTALFGAIQADHKAVLPSPLSVGGGATAANPHWPRHPAARWLSAQQEKAENRDPPQALSSKSRERARGLARATHTHLRAHVSCCAKCVGDLGRWAEHGRSSAKVAPNDGQSPWKKSAAPPPHGDVGRVTRSRPPQCETHRKSLHRARFGPGALFEARSGMLPQQICVARGPDSAGAR